MVESVDGSLHTGPLLCNSQWSRHVPCSNSSLVGSESFLFTGNDPLKIIRLSTGVLSDKPRVGVFLCLSIILNVVPLALRCPSLRSSFNKSRTHKGNGREQGGEKKTDVFVRWCSTWELVVLLEPLVPPLLSGSPTEVQTRSRMSVQSGFVDLTFRTRFRYGTLVCSLGLCS